MQGFDDHATRAAHGHSPYTGQPIGMVPHPVAPHPQAIDAHLRAGMHDLHVHGAFGRPAAPEFADHHRAHGAVAPSDPIFTGAAIIALAALLAGGLYAAIAFTPSLTLATVASVVVVLLVGALTFEVAMRRPFLRLPLAATFAIIVVAGGSVAAARTAGVDHAVNDTLPTASGSTMPGASTTLLSGTFQSLAHDTSGTAQVVAAPGGARQLALADFSSAAGPDLQVYLTAGDPSGSSAGDFVSLGKLKGTSGNQLYDIPQGTDLTKYTNVVIWCRIASAAFGKAPLATTDGGQMHTDAMQGLPGGQTTMANPETLFTGAFTGLAQQTGGTATIVAKAGDVRELDLSNFTTGKGPDLQVYLVAGDPQVDADVSDFITLGALKGTAGNSSYTVPAGTDLTRYTSVVIWCAQAKTAFGKAPLTRA